MGRLTNVLLICSIIVLLTGCPLRDWIRSGDENAGVDEFKRITNVVKKSDKTNAFDKIENQDLSEISKLFRLLSYHHQLNPGEQKVFFNDIYLTFKQNPTLLSALFLSIIEVTKEKNKAKLAVNSSLMNSIDFSQADADLLEMMKLFNVLSVQDADKIRLENKIKLYIVENSKYKKTVSELNAQINALKNIDESIFAREIELDNQE